MNIKTKNIVCDLIIDGDYILHKLAYKLHHNNCLYGLLYRELINIFNKYTKLYYFNKIYLISDDIEKSWRNSIYEKYTKNNYNKFYNGIDWEFVYTTYCEFKEKILNNATILYADYIESFDWISHIVNLNNKNNISNIIISNNELLHQLIKINIIDFHINIQYNDGDINKCVYIPYNYGLFLYYLKKYSSSNVFDLNDNLDFYNLIVNMLKIYNVHEIKNIMSLMEIVIKGYKKRNIDSVVVINNRGIGDIGAKKIIDEYEKNYGIIDDINNIKIDEIISIICEYKKIKYMENYYYILKNIKNNLTLFSYNNYPNHVIEKMNLYYKNNDINIKLKI